MRSSFTIGRLFGIRIKIDWSWLLIFLLVTWNLSAVFGATHLDWSVALRWSIALSASLLFFLSVLAHEMAHSLMARAQGIPVRGITLFLFGGVSNIQREPPSPRAEFFITIVGPITSILIGIFITAVGSFLAAPTAQLSLNDPAALTAELSPLTTILLWLGPINILLGLFNMIPGFPLDGGRILRSLLWALNDNLRLATLWAARVGQGIAWLMIFGGIAMVFGVRLPFFGTGLSGLWLAFIGWFLNTAAAQSYQQVVIQDILEDVPVTDLMRDNPPTATASATVAELVRDQMLASDENAIPVMEDGRLQGLVTLSEVSHIPQEERERKLVRDIMTPIEELATLSTDECADEALNQLQRQNVRYLPVMENGRFAGLLRRRDILRWLQLHRGEDESEKQTIVQT